MSNEILENFARAIKKLDEVLAVPKDEISRDSAIKRFELCFDLVWKSIKNQIQALNINKLSKSRTINLRDKLRTAMNFLQGKVGGFVRRGLPQARQVNFLLLGRRFINLTRLSQKSVGGGYTLVDVVI